MSIAVNVCKTPGEIKNFDIPEGSKVRDALEAAGIKSHVYLEYDIRVVSTNTLDTLLSDNDVILLVKRVPEEMGFKHIPKNPPVIRDISFVIPDTMSSSMVTDTILQHSPLIKSAMPVNLYSSPSAVGRDKVSITWRIVIQSDIKTLTTEETNILMDNVIHLVTTKLNVSLRGG